MDQGHSLGSGDEVDRAILRIFHFRGSDACPCDSGKTVAGCSCIWWHGLPMPKQVNTKPRPLRCDLSAQWILTVLITSTGHARSSTSAVGEESVTCSDGKVTSRSGRGS